MVHLDWTRHEILDFRPFVFSQTWLQDIYQQIQLRRLYRNTLEPAIQYAINPPDFVLSVSLKLHIEKSQIDSHRRGIGLEHVPAHCASPSRPSRCK